MKTEQRQLQAGFSLVELMVVVAIIGILATIAVPNFQRFQAKAKQSNAKVELAAVYTTQKSFFTEYQTYHGFLPGMGLIPDGIDQTSATWAPLATATRYYATASGTPTAQGAAAGNWPQSLPAAPAPSTFTGFSYTAAHCSGLTIAANLSAGTPAVTAVVGVNSFTAVAAGCPRAQNQATPDVWTMNENKILVNATSGI